MPRIAPRTAALPDGRPPTPRRARRRRWGIAAAWWTLDAFITVTNYHRMGAGDEAQRAAVVLATAVSAALWVPLTVFAFWLAARVPLERGAWARRLPVHVAAALGVCLARAGAVVVLNPWVGWYPALPPLPELLATSVANNLLLFWMLVGVGHALLFADRTRERDERLVRAELDALKLQLHPHFLFNTLNAVAAYVRTDPDTAERMIGRLSQLLRHTLDAAHVGEVTLAEELRVLGAYVDIEQVRFADRLRVRWDVEPEARDLLVPHLFLQPLVENAIRHGIAPRVAPGTVTIVARRQERALLVAVRDDGVGFDAGTATAGVGLANTRSRLAHMYGAQQRFDVRAAPGAGAAVEMRLPLRPRAAVPA
ncbi:histidine kinase [Roseisolibacter sp. H3M3-2]|uniref:sensor histidine kinase n=1 Tax=Roseisolibacter sp. H3M3-2 TaxID=3031323 RepID=UPI0023DC1E35|nr:histidine kinase [Roseisolibacter sp. H3M3-2]MDF1502912.1 histidine kinase [Roseisolibacter sp. H3M3-2]